MKKILFCLLSVLILNISCGESEKEREAREQLERKDRIEKETAKILVAYNKAISEQKKNIKGMHEYARFMSISRSDLKFMMGNWRQEGWDTLRVFYKIDSLETAFANTFGEDDYNVLSIKTDNNFNEKMK